MSPLLLLATMAFAEEPVGQFDRLFTAEGATVEAAAAEPGAVPAGGWAWPALLSGGGLLAAWQLRKRANGAAPLGMRVVQRQSLGDKSSLVLVEVPDAAGGTRRLLLGSANGSLNLLNDLGLVETPATLAPLAATPVSVTLPPEQDEDDIAVAPSATLAPVDEFAQLLGDVLQERQAAPRTEGARFFNPEDLAPEPDRTTAELLAEFEPAVAPRRSPRGPRFSSRKPAAATPLREVAAPAAPPLRTATPAPVVLAAPRLPAADEPTPIGLRTVASKPAPAPAVAPAARPSGLSALVKDTLPNAQAARRPAKPAVTVAPTAPEVAPAAVFVAPAPIATPAPVLAASPPPAARPAARSMFTAPSLGGGVPAQPAPMAARQFVGPALRDPSLVAPTAGPRLRLAEERAAATAEVPPTHELLARLRNAQAEPERAVVNGNSPTRADGLKRRFEAITAAVGGR